jgi:hypothetical protein
MWFPSRWLLYHWKRPGSLSLLALISLGFLLVRAGNPPLFMDEAFVLRGGAHLISERTLNPPWHEWPPMAAYAAVPSIGVSAFWGSLNTGLPPRDWAALAAGFHDTALVWPLRALSSLALVISAWAVGKLAQRITRSITSGLTAFLVIVLGSPVLLQYAAWGLPDLPMLACGSLAMLVTCASSRHLRPNNRAVLAGLLVGMASAWKFHGGLMVFSVLGLLLLRPEMPLWLSICRCLLAAGLGFFTLSPTFLFAPIDAWGGLQWLLGNLGRDRYAPQEQTALLLPPPMWKSIQEGLALPVIGSALLIRMVGFFCRSREFTARNSGILTALLFTPVLTGMLVLVSQRRDGNYLLPAIPGIVVVLVWAAQSGTRALRRFPPHGIWRWSLLVLPAAALTANHALFFMGSPHPRAIMSRLIHEQQNPQMHILRVGGYTPKIWCPAEIDDFLGGPGRTLGEIGRKEFFRRLTQAPQARFSTTLSERATTPAQVLRQLTPGTYIVSTRILRERIQNLPKGTDGWKDFFDMLEADPTFELIAETLTGSQEDQRLYRVRSVRPTEADLTEARP